jgi:hypothetical protein
MQPVFMHDPCQMAPIANGTLGTEGKISISRLLGNIPKESDLQSVLPQPRPLASIGSKKVTTNVLPTY